MIATGSLAGYSNLAYAISMKATVTQKAKSASGTGNMWFGEQAGIFNANNLVVYVGDKSISTSNQYPGNDQLTGYSGSASALKDSAQKEQTIGSLSSSCISDGTIAWNKDANGNILTSSDTVVSITNGQISKYVQKATATRNSAQASMKMGSAKGDAISSATNSVTIEGDNAYSKMDMAAGSISGYSAVLTATNTGATASLDESAKCAIGANIIFRSAVYNKEGDHAESYAELYGGIAHYLGSINGYSSNANAMHSQASIKQSAKTATGDQVWFSIISAYFTRLAQGDTAEAANTAASNSVNSEQVMTLQGNYKSFKLK